ncbi:MAG: hypothetical protein ACT4NY_32090 [Pseudonocardiales bacterium]
MELSIEYNDGHGSHVHVELETLAIAPYVKIDDQVKPVPRADSENSPMIQPTNIDR